MANLMLLTVMTGLYGVWFYMTRNAKRRGENFGTDTLAYIASFVFKLMCTICSLHLEIIVPEEPGKEQPRLPYKGDGLVAAVSPHGSLPLTSVPIGMPLFRLDPLLRPFKIRHCAASVLFYIPVVRELLLIFGCRHASKSNLLQLLLEGHSIGINPGGNYEMASTSSTHEAIYCQKGLGFIRVYMYIYIIYI
jgi:hypothetical protein